MNCVPDCVKYLSIIAIYGGSSLLLAGIRKLDEEIRACEKSRLMRCWFWFSTFMVSAMWISKGMHTKWEVIGLSLLGVYLVVASTMDRLLCQVNDFMQFIGLLGGGICLISMKLPGVAGKTLIVFALLQYLVFNRMYGKADGMAFLVCALYWVQKGEPLVMGLLHMLISFLLLTVVQMCKRNVSLRGRLKEPVALYPYIMVGFGAMLSL